MSDSPAPKSSRRCRRKPPTLPATRSAATALERTEPEAEKEAKLEAAARKLLAVCTVEELQHDQARRNTARGPRYREHPKREGSVLFEGSAEEHRNRLVEATGCRDLRVADSLLSDVAGTIQGNELTSRRFEAAGAMLASIAPRTPLEGVLCAQMAAVHQVAMTLLASGGDPDVLLIRLCTAVDAANKLLRTFTLQVEALSRLRSPGVTEQRVVVQHVTVADGGQAVIGAVSRTPGGEGG